MEWKTASVEAGDGFSKLTWRTLRSLVLSQGQAPKIRAVRSSDLQRSAFSSGMQKDGLTMFHLSCYSC